MKIYISRPRLKLFFWVPTSILRWKWMWKKMVSCADYVEYDELVELLPSVVKGIKKYIKTNGHFYIVDVQATDGTKVKIKV